MGESSRRKRLKRKQHDAELRGASKPVPEEELAAELAVPAASALRDDNASANEVREQARPGRAVGWFGLVFAIASLFVWPLVLGLTAAALGYYAYRQGSRGLGVWSMTIGLLAAVAYIVFIPITYVLS